ncbi:MULTISPECIES: type II toxin-antitoxin system VapC family toxin [unclassified Sulfitobacter]|uniref:type II toxin-antitoxin system VapC family toxin n=1 Tax=unclassified Sulfitobacter TaxID=196795 RepID=UPI0007C2B094|nr:MULTISPECIES: type II toxin-antitoxin system VapC family toxin [unclassified Sulfitobacter]KZX95830.1 pilus assembly protein CpaF [Sulfitobacter sp. HI0027]KZX96710.1 pilus assembly protein CpaF [Sulfitobacter sp. HI0021]KZZ01257.1 pilus assembly protein CpaF [Sulfitobacter sp. HI0076]
MIYILDTNVISAVRRAGRAPKVAAWLAGKSEADLFLSVITLGEIERGIRRQEGRDPEFAQDLRHWLERTVAIFGDRVLDFTAQDALVWGDLSARIGHAGADLMIAAQALSRDAAVVTGNGADFAPTGARIIDPF